MKCTQIYIQEIKHQQQFQLLLYPLSAVYYNCTIHYSNTNTTITIALERKERKKERKTEQRGFHQPRKIYSIAIRSNIERKLSKENCYVQLKLITVNQ
jgi:hypothetical protein